MDFDVVVVGAGPGGASSAYFLNKGGAKVLVIEKKALPRYKVCAGGVPVAALEYFPFSFDPVNEDHIDRATFCYKEDSITQDVPPKCLSTVMRDEFDYHILKNASVEVMDRSPVEQISVYRTHVLVKVKGGKTVRCKYVIGGDGAASVVKKWLGLLTNMDMGLALEAEVKVRDDILDRYRSRILVSFGLLERGYFWIFPKRSHLSVGIGNMTNGVRMRDVLVNVLKERDLPTQGVKVYAHPLPIYTGRYATLHKNRAFLVGDAANLVDPLTGEGIRHAILSGKIAAECILKSKEYLYSREIYRKIGKDLIWAKRLSDFFYTHQYFCYKYLVKNRFIFRDLMRIISNRCSYKRTLFSVPLYFLLNLSFKSCS